MGTGDAQFALPQIRRLRIHVLSSVVVSVAVCVVLLGLLSAQSSAVHDGVGRDVASLAGPLAPAAPIPPSEGGYPKLSLSTKSVTPTLAAEGGATLVYIIEIRNTGATTATATTLYDPLPANVTYNGDAWASHGTPPVVSAGVLNWTGEVGFDSTVVVTFSASVDPAFSGEVTNTAVISDPFIALPVTKTAKTVVTNDPILVVEKTSWPEKPGAEKPLAYELWVTNMGQPAVNLPITVTDRVPLSTTLRDIDPDGYTSAISDVVTWTRQINLDLGQSTSFTFTVDVNDVLSGTVIANEDYAVAAPFGVKAGELYTVTVVDPILWLAKQVWPDPPGSNRELTFTLTLLNQGSLATDMVITDRVPAGVSYVRGGAESSRVVSWSLPSLATGESAHFTYTVYISDVANVPVVNYDYGVCSAEGICAAGEALTSVVQGPIFEAYVTLDPIAHKPGGGSGTEVTPTLVVHNVGVGNALDARATLYFERLSVSANDLYADPAIGTPPPFPDGPECAGKCKSYVWVGSLAHGTAVTFTTFEGQSTIGGEEGTNYTATVVVTDALLNMTTPPVTGTAVGTVTHYANVQPLKSAPSVIGRGQLLTYTLHAYNRGLSTQLPPVLTDAVPLSTTFVRASDGGVMMTLSETLVVSWSLPLLSPGEGVMRTFTVQVDDDLVSGTHIVNWDYSVTGYGNIVTGAVTSGPPVTTTVKEVGLIDSYKVVTPQLSLPGPGNVLTYYLHLVNSSALPLSGVTAYDVLPWADSTYQRNAVASAGQLVSDIISIDWAGDIGPFAEVVITGSVLVDVGFEGALTNTVVISHPDLLAPVEKTAVAYVTSKPVLLIRKSASPDPVALGERLTYHLQVTNLGQQATALVITDVLPSNVTYVPDSAVGGEPVDGAVRWDWPVLDPGEHFAASFRVTVEAGSEVVNALYAVNSAEGVFAFGPKVVTSITGGGQIFLPIILRQ